MKALLFLMAASAAGQAGWNAQIADLVRPAGGHVGVSMMVVESGERAGFHGGQRFPMQSVYKLPIGMAVLRDVDAGKLGLEQEVWVEKEDQVPMGLHSPLRDAHPGVRTAVTVRELLRYMVSESDGTASDVLLRQVGGAERVTAYLRGLGVAGIVVATSEAEMARGEMVQYRNWAQPDGMVLLLRRLATGEGLSKRSHGLLMQWMTETGTGPHRLKGELPAGVVVAHKTGTSNTVRGLTRATNDVGLVTLPDGRHLAIAVFVSDSRAAEAVREGVIAKVARVAWDRFAGGTGGRK